jgi:hypothetical protein
VRCFLILLLTCLSAWGTAGFSQIKDADLPSYLAGVTERGRDLYAYDQAAWHGTDAFFELHPDTSGLTHYVCVKTAKGWVVTFPKWNVAHDHLIAAFEARETEQPGLFKATAVDPPHETSDELIPMERALETATRDFKAEARPYNTAVLPAPNGQLYVYIYPGQTKETVWPIGGDVRYTISADGTQIVERRQMHKTILDIEYPSDKKVVAGMHSHILSNVPEDTDVLCVLERRPSMPEYVGTPDKRVFVIQTDGTITLAKK